MPVSRRWTARCAELPIIRHMPATFAAGFPGTHSFLLKRISSRPSLLRPDVWGGTSRTSIPTRCRSCRGCTFESILARAARMSSTAISAKTTGTNGTSTVMTSGTMTLVSSRNNRLSRPSIAKRRRGTRNPWADRADSVPWRPTPRSPSIATSRRGSRGPPWPSRGVGRAVPPIRGTQPADTRLPVGV